MRTSVTYNFMWTRLTFSERAADGFGVICEAVGQMMFCCDGGKTESGKAITNEFTIREELV